MAFDGTFGSSSSLQETAATLADASKAIKNLFIVIVSIVKHRKDSDKIS